MFRHIYQDVKKITVIVLKNRHKITGRDLVYEVSLYYNRNTENKWKGVY